MSENILKQIDTEIARLQQARSLLMDLGTSAKRGPGRPPNAKLAVQAKNTKRRTLSAAAREKIRQAQLKRWAATKTAAKKAAK